MRFRPINAARLNANRWATPPQDTNPPGTVPYSHSTGTYSTINGILVHATLVAAQMSSNKLDGTSAVISTRSLADESDSSKAFERVYCGGLDYTGCWFLGVMRRLLTPTYNWLFRLFGDRTFRHVY
jgi:hypothetical protein